MGSRSLLGHPGFEGLRRREVKASQSCIGKDSRLGAYLPAAVKRRAPTTSVSVGTILEATNSQSLADETEGSGAVMKEVKEFLLSSTEVNADELKEADK